MKTALPIVATTLLAFAAPAVAQEHSDHGQHMAGDTQTQAPAPAAPTDWAADQYHNPAEMAAARKALFASTSDMISHKIMIDELEWRAHKGRDAIAWTGKAWVGGDLDRFMVRTEGEAAAGGAFERAEVRALWSHAVSPNWNVEAGVRHDFRPRPNRTYATVGLDGMLPYWIELEGALFLSDKGDLLARAELSHEMRLTQTLIFKPHAELNFSAQNVPELGTGSGLTDMELGVRLRYAPVPSFAPYIGVDWERSFGDTARYARAEGDRRSSTSLVIGISFWF